MQWLVKWVFVAVVLGSSNEDSVLSGFVGLSESQAQEKIKGLLVVPDERVQEQIRTQYPSLSSIYDEHKEYFRLVVESSNCIPMQQEVRSSIGRLLGAREAYFALKKFASNLVKDLQAKHEVFLSKVALDPDDLQRLNDDMNRVKAEMTHVDFVVDYRQFEHTETLDDGVKLAQESAIVKSLLAEVTEEEKAEHHASLMSDFPDISREKLEDAKTVVVLVEKLDLNSEILRNFQELTDISSEYPLTLAVVKAGQAYLKVTADVLATLGQRILNLLAKEVPGNGNTAAKQLQRFNVHMRSTLRRLVAHHKDFYRFIRSITEIHIANLDESVEAGTLKATEAEKIKERLQAFDEIAQEARHGLTKKLGYPTIKSTMNCPEN